MSTDPCVFCDIIAGRVPVVGLRRDWPAVVAFEPLNPVTPGHLLVVPVGHVPDVGKDPWWSSLAMEAAAQLAAQVGDCNIITSKGPAATQTVNHLHLHVVPRRVGDGLALPWTGQKVDAHD